MHSRTAPQRPIVILSHIVHLAVTEGFLPAASKRGQPLLLITEDLHWGDPSTLQLIDYLARRPGHSRLMWLGSVRPDEPLATDHPLHALRQALLKDPVWRAAVVRELLASGELVNLAPRHRLGVALHWHCWNLSSDVLDALTVALRQAAADNLRPVAPA